MKDFQHIATFSYPSDLTIAKSLLESRDIECYVKDELTIQVHNFVSNAIGGITLEIPKDKYASARSLLIESGFENDLIEPANTIIEQNEEVGAFSFLKILKFLIPVIVIAGLVLILIILVMVIFYDE